MTTEDKALALLNSVRIERGFEPLLNISRLTDFDDEALCRAIEQHEAFKQRVSFALKTFKDGNMHTMHDYLLEPFIIPKPKPDPLVSAMDELEWCNTELLARDLRTALDELGFEIKEKSK